MARLHRQGVRDGDSLLLAAGELPGHCVQPVRQANAIEQPPGPRLGPVRVDPQNVDRGLRHVLEDRPVREEVEALEDHPDEAPNRAEDPRAGQRRGLDAQAQAGDRHRPPLEGLQAVQAAQERALAPARRADDRRHLAREHSERYPMEHLQRAVTLDQVVHLNHAHAPPFALEASNRRSDLRENHDSGRLIAR